MTYNASQMHYIMIEFCFFFVFLSIKISVTVSTRGRPGNGRISKPNVPGHCGQHEINSHDDSWTCNPSCDNWPEIWPWRNYEPDAFEQRSREHKKSNIFNFLYPSLPNYGGEKKKKRYDATKNYEHPSG